MNRKLKHALMDPVLVTMFAVTAGSIALDVAEHMIQPDHSAAYEERANPMSLNSYIFSRAAREISVTNTDIQGPKPAYQP